jgi:SAM-dependent methyltransferase
MAISDSPFAHIDQAPDEIRQQMVGYLDGTARHPELQRLRTAALELFAPVDRERLLDAGCGAGEVARQLGARVGPQGSVTALDSSAGLISVATSRADAGPVSYVLGDMTHLDFPDGYFDGVRSERALQHLSDPDAAIRELARVTRPGGRLCLIDTDWTSVVHDGFDHLDEVMDALGAAGLFPNPSLGRTVRGRMVAAGLRSVTTLPVTLRFMSPGDAATVVPFFDRSARAMLPDGVPDEPFERLFAAVEQAIARGVFLFAFTMWITVGRVRVTPA